MEYMQQTRTFSGKFSLKMDRATFNKEVVPWLHTTFGNKRGKKKDWVIDEAREISQRDLDRPNKSWQLQAAIQKGYYCKVAVKSNRDAITFLARWGDYCDKDSQIIGHLKGKNVETVSVEGPWEKIAHMVKWMKRNVQPYSWAMSGGFRGRMSFLGALDPPTWEFYLSGDDAKIAFLMVKPN